MPATVPGLLQQLDALIRTVPDFPKPGIVFKDITPLLGDPAGLCLAVELMANPFRKSKIDLVCAAESRGFIFGTAIAQTLGTGFVPIRKPGKLPAAKLREEYVLEYGTDTLEIHADAVAPGQRVLLVDDLLATGGTLRASLGLLGRLKAEIVGVTVMIELASLGGRSRLTPHQVHPVLTY